LTGTPAGRSHPIRERKPMKLFTIGHSNHPLDKLAGLAKGHGVLTLVDVRSAPYSRYNVQFNKEHLERELGSYGLAYVFEGDSLGGRPSDPTCYRSGEVPDADSDFIHEVDYREVMKRPWFAAGIGRLLCLAAKEPTAILCSEENPASCHRHHLIACHLAASHPEVEVAHIRGDGSIIAARSIPSNRPAFRQLPLF
jgi:uncharacterized protein (DUF488 family)